MNALIAIGVAGVLLVALVPHLMGRVQDAVRNELRDARVLLEVTDVRAAISGRAVFSASETWLAGDLLVTDRAVVLFPISRVIPMKQPPFVIVKAGDEATISERWGVHRTVASSGPGRSRSLMGKPRVSLKTRGKRSRWTLHVETRDIEGLFAALAKFVGGEEPGGAYRERGASGSPDTQAPTEAASLGFTEGFLHRDPEVGFRQSPFVEAIGHRDGVVCFESDAADEPLWEGAASDLETLESLPLGDCYYGAASYPVEPFLAADPGAGPLTGARVLEALRVRNFQSEHIRDLDRTAIPSPGYIGYSINDEVHTDFEGQCLFYRVGYDEGQDEELEDDPRSHQQAMDTLAVHDGLKGLVDGPLWYVLLHEDGGIDCPLVALFALGRSRRGGHLIGVASQQVCHNLCD